MFTFFRSGAEYMNYVFLALLCMPVIEIAVLISVGGVLGLPLTLALVISTAILGTYMLRHQGLSLLLTAQRQIAQGVVPARTMAEGLILAVGGALLLTPGFITDVVGFLCLFPASRKGLVALVRGRMQGVSSSVDRGRTDGTSSVGDPNSVVLEGEYKKEP